MRIVAGIYKGRTLVAPKGDTRPTLDRMKETLFNIVNGKLCNAKVLDLFAGSGQIALECLSRGADSAILCDNSRDAVTAINANFSKIGVKPNLFVGDFRACLDSIVDKLDFIFVDPPYLSGVYDIVLDKIQRLDILQKDGIVVCEHSVNVDLGKQIGQLTLYDRRKMGSVLFSFYKYDTREDG